MPNNGIVRKNKNDHIETITWVVRGLEAGIYRAGGPYYNSPWPKPESVESETQERQ